MGPSGPPIPPMAFYSVIRYPEKRVAPAAGEALKHFIFVVPEGATAEDEKDTKSLVDAAAAPAVKVPGQGPGWVGGRWNGGGSLWEGSEDGAPCLQASLLSVRKRQLCLSYGAVV